MHANTEADMGERPQQDLINLEPFFDTKMGQDFTLYEGQCVFTLTLIAREIRDLPPYGIKTESIAYFEVYLKYASEDGKSYIGRCEARIDKAYTPYHVIRGALEVCLRLYVLKSEELERKKAPRNDPRRGPPSGVPNVPALKPDSVFEYTLSNEHADSRVWIRVKAPKGTSEADIGILVNSEGLSIDVYSHSTEECSNADVGEPVLQNYALWDDFDNSVDDGAE
jgi:hypothetical protein